VLRQLYGETPAADFGPNALRTVREAMIRGDAKVDPPRPAWSRQTVNRRVHRVRAIFKWAVAHELLPVSVYQALCTMEGLRRGQSEARETEPVSCAPETAIAAVKAIVSRQVAAMIDLQLLTGMRPGEVVIMRPCDLDMGGKVWLYRPAHHKTEHHGKARTVYLGPRAQDVVRPFLAGRSVAAPLFSPAEAEADRRARLHEARKTPAGQGNGPGTNRVESPRVRPADQYTVDSYRRAISRACDLADRAAKAEALAAGVKVDAGSRLVPAWHPHQLRHNYATNVRKGHGLEAAAVLLGHSSAVITDAVYAERDQGKAVAIAEMVG
jgi:integrase